MNHPRTLRDLWQPYQANVALRIPDSKNFSYQELWEAVQSVAAGLQMQGIGPQDHVACYQLDKLQSLILLAACLHVGAVMVPLSDKYPENELSVFTQHVSVKTLVLSEQLEEWLDLPGRDIAAYRWRTDDPALIVFTSGSSGAHKGVQLSWGNLLNSASGTNSFYQITSHDSWCISLPLFHVGGLMIAIRMWLVGGACEFRMQPVQLEQEILASSATMFSFVPTQMHRLLAKREAVARLTRAKAILLGGAATANVLFERCLAEALPISVTYGASEAASQLTATSPGAMAQAGVVGRPLAQRDLRIIDKEIQFRGPTRFQGYWRQGKWEQPFLPEGWFATADEGEWNAKGQLVVLGRRDEVFMAGGENISPREIEGVLRESGIPGEFMVIPMRDVEYGQLPVLVIWGEEEPPRAEIRSLLKKRLPGLKRPRQVFWWPKEKNMLKPAKALLQKSFAVPIVPEFLRDLD